MNRVPPAQRTASGIILPPTETGSSYFHHILKSTVEAFPTAFRDARLPLDAKGFKRDYARALVRFEALRVGAPERVDIARHMVTELHRGLAFHPQQHGTPEPLADHLTLAAPRQVELDRALAAAGASAEPSGWQPEVPCEGVVHRGAAVVTLAEALHRQHHISDAALAAITAVVSRAQAGGGRLDLSAYRFALIGAAAELAPTMMLLRAGATVLWLDKTLPVERMSQDELRAVGHRVIVPRGVNDVLADPRGVADALRAFHALAPTIPLDIGLFAYAPGEGRELRLAAGMDAIVRSLDQSPAIVRSVSMFVSPTIPAEVQPRDHARARGRGARPAAWLRALERLGALRRPGSEEGGGHPVAHAIVALQGPTYQAAQYLAKLVSAEVYATQGLRLDGPRRPIAVSANVAGITATKSLAHPLFEAGFIGAPTFGIRIFEPATTRNLALLLVLHDILESAAPAATPAARAQALHARQLHGGVYNLPWVLDDVIRAGAVLGLAKKPQLAWAMARRGRGR